MDTYDLMDAMLVSHLARRRKKFILAFAVRFVSIKADYELKKGKEIRTVRPVQKK